MNEWPPVAVCLITYKRTDVAVRTVRGVRAHLDYPSIVWHVADDGSPREHVEAIAEAIGGPFTFSDAARKGVGRSMNLGMAECLRHADYILWLEDDWELTRPFDLRPCVEFLHNTPDVGMVRLGYISPEIRGQLVGGAGHLWWKLDKGPTYTFVGHASLRHRRFCEAYGPYAEGLPPGETELWMCGQFTRTPGPTVAVPSWTGEWGVFGHIGAESLKNLQPEGGNG